MPRYGLVWLEIEREHYASLPAAAREQIDARIEQLRENSRKQPRSAYDEVIVHAVVHEHQRLIILRLV